MVYIYTTSDCPKCVKLKEEYNVKGVKYQERSSSRIKSPEDGVDCEALVQASMQNMQLPVVVEIDY